jgi:hypothetical protein
MRFKAIALCALLCGCQPRLMAAESDPVPPLPEIPGYRLELNYPVFTAATLWDYINGAADAFLSYHFIDLHIGEYSDGAYTVKVELYRHASPGHAYGMYALERAPEYAFESIGLQGYAEPTLVNFVTGNYYVKLMANQENAGRLLQVARVVEAQLGQNPELPGLLRRFPAKAQLPYSDGFVATGFLGHEFLENVYTAQYEADGRRFLFFAMECHDCAEVLRRYYAFARADMPDTGDGFYRITDRYNGDIVMLWKESLLVGAVDCPSEAVFMDMAGGVLEHRR